MTYQTNNIMIIILRYALSSVLPSLIITPLILVPNWFWIPIILAVFDDRTNEGAVWLPNSYRGMDWTKAWVVTLPSP